MARFNDIAGQKVNHLTAVRFVGRNKDGRPLWEFDCDLCGSRTVKLAKDVRGGHTKSCGCNQFAGHRRTHGDYGSPEYVAWIGLRQRCNDPGDPGYHNYGGRGIKVCERWDDFAAFLADMGRKPSPKHSIDRVDNAGPYSPENCRWATREEQSRNTRQNHLLTFEGKTQTVVEWAEEVGLVKTTLFARLQRGWPVKEALTLPRGARNWKKRLF